LNPFRIFVTATDTGVGKTQAAGALLSLLADRGDKPAAFKPYESGCDDLRKPADALFLREASRSDDPLERVCPHRFKAPLAPGIAARRAGMIPSFERTLEAFDSFRERSLVCEGAGGLRVPLDADHEVIDLIVIFRLPVLLVARPGLGTLNHVALSLEALERRRVSVRAVLLSTGTEVSDPSEKDNPAELAACHGVKVLGPVPFVADPARRREAFRRALVPLLRERDG
jgi:dethiobiotin synthetase